jgi:hypothetical protein
MERRKLGEMLMDMPVTAEEFMAHVITFKDAVLSWSEDNTRLVLTADSDIGVLRYLAPNAMEMDIDRYSAFILHVGVRHGLPEFNVIPAKKDKAIRLDAYEFLERLKAAEGRSIATDSANREIVLYDWVGDEETGKGEVVTYLGPDPDRLDFLQYLEFLREIYKIGHLKDFVYAYVFGRLAP